MFNIAHDLTVRTPLATVFHGVSTPAGLDTWWTLSSSGKAVKGAEYRLGFGESLVWRAVVTDVASNRLLALRMTDAAADWMDTVVRFELEEGDDATVLHFTHGGWAEQSPHYRRTSYCWAMYLRLLRVFCETGAVTPYDARYYA